MLDTTYEAALNAWLRELDEKVRWGRATERQRIRWIRVAKRIVEVMGPESWIKATSPGQLVKLRLEIDMEPRRQRLQWWRLLDDLVDHAGTNLAMLFAGTDWSATYEGQRLVAVGYGDGGGGEGKGWTKSRGAYRMWETDGPNEARQIKEESK